MWISHSGEQQIYYNHSDLKKINKLKFFVTCEWKAQQSVTLMDDPDVGDIAAQRRDMEISASLLWPWKEAPWVLPWAAPSLSSAPPVNGCEGEHLDRFDRPTLRRKWSSANLFLTKKKQNNCRHALLGRDGSLLIMAISFCKWPQIFCQLFIPKTRPLSMPKSMRLLVARCL